MKINKGAIVEHIINWTLLLTIIPALALMLLDEFPVAIQQKGTSNNVEKTKNER